MLKKREPSGSLNLFLMRVSFTLWETKGIIAISYCKIFLKEVDLFESLHTENISDILHDNGPGLHRLRQ